MSAPNEDEFIITLATNYFVKTAVSDRPTRYEKDLIGN